MRRPAYTTLSCIKKVFRPGERSLPRTDIIDRLTDCLPYVSNGQDVEQTLTEILQMPVSPVRVGRTEAIIELLPVSHPVFELAYRYLREIHTPRTIEQILQKLRKNSPLSWNQLTRTLVLEQDPRFVQFEQDQRWYLAEWQVANDHVFAYAARNQMDRIALRSVLPLMEHELKLSSKEYVFVPELDDRFRMEGENLYICIAEDGAAQADSVPVTAQEPAVEQLAQTEVMEAEAQTAAAVTDATATAEAVTVTTEAAETATTPPTTNPAPYPKEDVTMTTMTATQPVNEQVEQLIRQAVSLLETRNQEMQAEVVGHFQQSNMEAIEILMKEKHKNEQAANGLLQVISALEQQ
ncbi:hypothetical protein [Brevibacillus dissolubilis]|uniref:hypothetical protein n=1 Tax=Brevibacillus dissolubilis TaxID=1844116 RepID=UPI001117A78E|nr:hypothetical protein [Brevibacillus dissolubilis]